MKTITVTVPTDCILSLENIAGAFLNMANELRKKEVSPSGTVMAFVKGKDLEPTPPENENVTLKDCFGPNSIDENKAAKAFGGSSAQLPPPVKIPDPSASFPPTPPATTKIPAPPGAEPKTVNDKSLIPDSNVPPPPTTSLDLGLNIPPTLVVNGVELDTDGRPWDIRIDTKQKTKVKATGKWKLKRGADRVEAQKIIDQLIASMAVRPTIPAPPADDVPEALQHTADVINSVPPPPPEQKTDLTFPEFLQKTTERMQSLHKPNYDAAMKKVLTDMGLDGNILTLMSREDLLPEIDVQMDVIWNQLNGVTA